MAQQLGWLDTNIFVTPLYGRDPNAVRCTRIISALRGGRAEGWIDPLVVHELLHVLNRFRWFPSRKEIGDYVQGLLNMEGVRADDKQALLDALTRWDVYGVDFVDAWLVITAKQRHRRVCTIHERDFRGTINTFRTARI